MELKRLFNYDPLTGHFTRIVSSGSARAGSIADTVNSVGYVQLRVLGKTQLAHRMVYLWMTGTLPKFVDHKDGVRNNNRWSNIRSVSRVVNNRNKAKHSNNSSGQTGVSWDSARQKWVAHIGVGGKCKRLGRFDHKQDAILARLTAEKEFGYWVDKARDCL